MIPNPPPLIAWYFPYLNLTYNHGLSAMACLFDRVLRVVPFGLHPHDGQFVKILQEETGLLETIQPPDAIASKVDPVFINWLEGAFNRNDPAYTALFGKPAIERTAAKPHRTFKAERHPALTAKLDELGLSKEFAANWKGTSRLVQDLYLTCLAHAAYRKHQSDTPTLMITDRPLYTRALHHARFGFGTQQVLRLTLELTVPVPQSWRNTDLVDFKALAKFRKNSSIEHVFYFSTLWRLMEQLSQIDAIKSVEKVIRHFFPMLSMGYEQCRVPGIQHHIPLERGNIFATVLLPHLPFQGTIPKAKSLGVTSYRVDCLPIAETTLEKIQKNNQPIFTLSLEEPLIKPRGLRGVKEQVKKLIG